ncbi:MAG: acyl-CoA reductase [Verrucomicrobiales bacterium]|nr:acyl-CoA reductase [Verrucomicrobiales bacterium]
MNLPNYFLADLSPGAPLDAATVREACLTLKRNRARFLADRSTEEMIGLLAQVASEWLRPHSAFRVMALEAGPAATGFGRATLARGLDAFFEQLTVERLRALLVQELGDARALDQCVSEATPGELRRARIATGPELLVHITAGNLPAPALMSMVLGLLTRSAQFVKCAQGASLLPRLFAHSIYRADAKVGACLEVAEWPGGNETLESALFEQADCVTATGRDETLAAIRARLPVRTRFVGYGHRVSFAFVTRVALSVERAPQILADAATDIVAWNQLGCLSPHVIYVQRGGDWTPRQFASELAGELERREAGEPRGAVPIASAAEIASRRAAYQVRAAHSPATALWQSAGSTAWTVVYEEDPTFVLSCLNRFIYVKPVQDLDEALRQAAAVRGQVSTVGLAATDLEWLELARALARWGVTRVCPLGRMQTPPLTWRHDGRPPLGELITWTDVEM